MVNSKKKIDIPIFGMKNVTVTGIKKFNTSDKDQDEYNISVDGACGENVIKVIITNNDHSKNKWEHNIHVYWNFSQKEM